MQKIEEKMHAPEFWDKIDEANKLNKEAEEAADEFHKLFEL